MNDGRMTRFNRAQQRALLNAIGAAQDNLVRATMQQRAQPTWKSGNDESIEEVIAGYQRHLDELQEGLA